MAFRLTNDVEDVLKDNLIVVDIIFGAERVHEVVEKTDEAEEGLPTHAQIDIFRQVDEVWQHNMQSELIAAIFAQ